MAYILGLALLLISPYVSITLLYFSFSQKRTLKVKHLYFFAFCCCLFISLVNATKIPANDLEWYLDSFQRAKGMSLLDYIPVSGPGGFPCSDLGYVVYSWVLSNLMNANVIAFKFIHSFICYSFLTIAVINVQKVFKLSARTILTALVVMCFLPYIYTMSLQLLRQFFAGCVLIFLMSKLFYAESWKYFLRSNAIFIILMVSFHKSSLIYFPLLLLPFLDTPFAKNRFKYLLILLALFVYQTIAQVLSLYIDENNAIGEAIQRASKDTTFELEGMTMPKIIVCLVLLLTALYVGHVQKRLQLKGLTKFCNIVIILGLFILLNMRQTELSLRFFFYMMPMFTFFYILVDRRYRLSFPIQLLVVIGCMAFWVVYLKIGTWEYNLPGSVFITPLLLY